MSNYLAFRNLTSSSGEEGIYILDILNIEIYNKFIITCLPDEGASGDVHLKVKPIEGTRYESTFDGGSIFKFNASSGEEKIQLNLKAEGIQVNLTGLTGSISIVVETRI